MITDGASTQGQGGGAGRVLGRLLVTLVVLALLGTVAMLLSQLNARTYTVQRQGDALVVMKGRQLPYGVAPFTPEDPALVDTYGPIPLEGRDPSPELLGKKFDDRESLDRALFKVLEELARPRVNSDDPKALEQAVYYVRRAARLRGLTDEQRATLTQLQAEIAFYQARKKLDEARRLAVDSVELLREAAKSDSRDARDALALLSQVEPLARGLEVALGEVHRGLVFNRPALPAAPASPELPAPPGSAAPTGNGTPPAPTPTPQLPVPPAPEPAAPPVGPPSPAAKDAPGVPPASDAARTP